ncbi:MAG: hypothetical protein JO295_00220 [Verrucomicrobia bacterium]|nr:hypothetical protein [Verrucomicrobiota bacterium]
MPSTADLARRIAEEAATLPVEKQNEVLDFVLFVKGRAQEAETSDDAAWERTLADARPRPKLDAFLRAAAEEGEEPLDARRL